MRKAVIGLFLLFPLSLAGCAQPTGTPTAARFSTTFIGAMDTVCRLIAYCPDEALFTRAVAAVREELERQEALLDCHRADSAVSRLNAAAGAPTACPAELCELLTRWQVLYRQVPGTNLAMGAVLRLWEAARENGVPPDAAALRQAGAHIAPERVVVDAANGVVTLTDPALSLDLGAVGKGQAADAVAGRLRGLGLDTFLLSFGESTLVCAGTPPDADGWRVAVREPDAVLNLSARTAVPEYAGVLTLTDGCIGVSGDYQKYFAANGTYYAHILEEATLYPARYCRAVCVIAPDAFTADHLSTALFAQPYAQGQAALEGLTGVQAMWIFADGSRAQTPGFGAFWREE